MNRNVIRTIRQAVAMAVIVISTTAMAQANDQSARITIRLLSDVTVDTNTITLGDIADVQGPQGQTNQLSQLVIAKNLLGDTEETIRAWRISRQLGDAGANLAMIDITGSALCRVRIAKQPEMSVAEFRNLATGKSLALMPVVNGTTSLETKIRGMIHDHLKSLPNNATVEIIFNPTVKSALALTEPTHMFRIQPEKKNDWLGLINFKVDVFKDGKLLQKLTILAKVEAEATILRAKATINARDSITEEDIENVTRKILCHDIRYITDVTELQHLRSRRMIHAGTDLTHDMFESLPLARRNELVTVVFRNGGLEIRTTGRALETGGLNETISVRNERSRDTFQGRLIEPGVVLVQSGSSIVETALADGSEVSRP